MKKILLAGVATLALTAFAHADCPAVTVADMGGLKSTYPQQFELAEFQAAASCTLAFAENPEIADLNARIAGNPSQLPPLAERLPREPLVVAPYAEIGRYGGVFNGLSNATEAGTSEVLSLRHVNLVRFSDDLVTIVPNIAKGWAWNEDFTELTFTLRAGHKWSDGQPFTAHDVAFWYNDMTMNPNVVEKPRDLWVAGGKPIEVEAVDDVTVVFRMAAPKPGLLATLATDFAQPFQPRHFLGRFHPDINPDADKLAQELGFETGYELIALYYSGSDWKDVPSPRLKAPEAVAKLPAAVVPTLESHIVVEDTTEGRRLVANPFFHMVDTAGNQLPYVSEIAETYAPDNEVRLLKLINGEVDYKAQSVALPDAPTLLDKQEAGDYTVDLRPQISMPTFSFNVTANDPEKRALFNERDFRVAMSHAIDRAEINSVAYFDLGEPRQYLAFDPLPPFASADQARYATAFDPERAAALLDGIGLTDRDGDGLRDLPSGKKLTLNLQFSTQGIPTTVAELVARNWSDIGVETVVKEVTSDEYRAAQSANELDVLAWDKGQPLPVVQGDNKLFVPPFGDYFGHRNAMLWAQYLETEGAEGVEPPAWVGEMAAKVAEWQTHEIGSDASNRLGAELIQAQLDAFLFIGTVVAPSPIYRSNDLGNFETPKTASYEYYRAYPYRTQQWFLARD
ncbi:ABC transporter substrate-binding protein [Stappia sp.]|uniref:ABC transporter substrate-binding protein n=1 Tax=Stappia sp. TaxID=1870903 RepID=UPI0032D8E12D